MFMTECVILYRVNGGRIKIVYDDDLVEVEVFPHMDAAIAWCDDSKLFANGQADYQIVELDEL
jgi:hypothetical protein